jgi:hypothetical protein
MDGQNEKGAGGVAAPTDAKVTADANLSRQRGVAHLDSAMEELSESAFVLMDDPDELAGDVLTGMIATAEMLRDRLVLWNRLRGRS